MNGCRTLRRSGRRRSRPRRPTHTFRRMASPPGSARRSRPGSRTGSAVPPTLSSCAGRWSCRNMNERPRWAGSVPSSRTDRSAGRPAAVKHHSEVSGSGAPAHRWGRGGATPRPAQGVEADACVRARARCPWRAVCAVRDQPGDDGEIRAVPRRLVRWGETAAVPRTGEVDPLGMPPQLLEQPAPVGVTGPVREPVPRSCRYASPKCSRSVRPSHSMLITRPRRPTAVPRASAVCGPLGRSGQAFGTEPFLAGTHAVSRATPHRLERAISSRPGRPSPRGGTSRPAESSR